MRVYLQDLLDGGCRILAFCGKHLTLLNLLHEGALPVAIGHNDTGLVGQSVRKNNISHLFKQYLLRVLNVWLVHFSQILLLLPLGLIVLRQLEISLTDVYDILD